MAWTRGAHTLKWGTDIRLNKDATVFGVNPNGLYTFGGGTAYSSVQILSASGQHNIQRDDPLPDALTGLLTATPYSYTVTAAASVTPAGNKFDEAAVRRNAYDFYFQDAWKISPRWNLTYGLRYEVNSPIREAKARTSVGYPIDAEGKPTSFFAPGARQIYLFNPQPITPQIGADSDRASPSITLQQRAQPGMPEPPLRRYSRISGRPTSSPVDSRSYSSH